MSFPDQCGCAKTWRNISVLIYTVQFWSKCSLRQTAGPRALAGERQ